MEQPFGPFPEFFKKKPKSCANKHLDPQNPCKEQFKTHEPTCSLNLLVVSQQPERLLEEYKTSMTLHECLEQHQAYISS